MARTSIASPYCEIAPHYVDSFAMKNPSFLLITALLLLSSQARAELPRLCQLEGKCAEAFAAPYMSQMNGSMSGLSFPKIGSSISAPASDDDGGSDCGGLPGKKDCD